ncbi:MAG: tyrosine--tRNA ligase [Clostridiales bacterium]|nr:tyrosine--tRNA ligase [Clostridiales bacterium]
MNVYDILNERGFIAQSTFTDELKEKLGKEKVTFYIGFDPTADSLHVGHFIQLMVMAHMQRAGHKPIALIGGGTAMIGDPSGRTDMRTMMTKETIAHNCSCFVKQMSKFIDFSDGKALLVNNADWLLGLNYVDFIRDIGAHFSVNRMLTAECYKMRMEKGLTFLEFNYMLMQGYDFLRLFQDYGCTLEVGGDDQWSNILAGVDLIRRKEAKEAFGLTMNLLTTADGKKMGKTQAGAVWLDPEKTSPYDFYQYWRNVDDADVEKCLSLLTFLPMDQVRELCKYKDERMNEAKRVLAYEVTKLIHSEEAAEEARKASDALFGGAVSMDSVPSVEIDAAQYPDGISVTDALVISGLCASKGEAKRNIQQGGVSLGDNKVTDMLAVIPADDLKNGILLKKGKKSFMKIIAK